jgi:hypothetical protein
MVLRRTYGTKRKEETGNYRKLHNEEFHDLYSSTNINEQIQVKENDMGRACGMNAGNDQCIQGSGEKN